jgi:multidrug efflux system membrane fusion protein
MGTRIPSLGLAMLRRSLLGAACCLLAVAAGCQPKPAAGKAAAEMPAVPVSYPVPRDVTDFVDFTGRTDSVYAVDVRARVTGYLIKRHFKDGEQVKKGKLLFEIDPGPYQAQLDQALSQVKLNEASLTLARSTYERDRAIARGQPGAVSTQQLNEDQAAVDEAMARLKAAESSTEVYKLNLGFTKIKSPIDGLISRAYMTEGNLVIQDQTLLTTIVSLDPMYVYFDLDEPTLNRLRKEVNNGRLKRLQDGSMPVLMGLQGEQGYPHDGTINFVNNQLNPTTGSITMRGVFPNPNPLLPPYRLAQTLGAEGLASLNVGAPAFLQPVVATGVSWLAPTPLPAGEQLLSPGMFVRIRLPIGKPYPALLVIDRAVGSDQGLKYVYVLDAHNKVQQRPVTTGALQADGLRVITKGLKKDDLVVVGGLPQIRPRLEVRPDRTTMPVLGPQTSNQSKEDDHK